jgi:hypothetical protein
MTEDEELLPRIGVFFLLVGFVLFIIFVASDFSHQVDFDLFFVAMLLIGVGLLFRRRKKPHPSAGRFGMISKMRADAKKRKEEKNKPKAKK